MTFSCRICGYDGTSSTYTVREMMLGTGDAFTYVQCERCHCLQIADIPGDMARYYPSGYYSFSSSSRDRTDNPALQRFRRLRNRASVIDSGIVSRLLRLVAPNRKLLPLFQLDLTQDSRILDVGCGSGWRLYALREAGFVHTLGIDPYISEDITYGNGLRILKRTIGEVDETWDVIMYHHSLEHVPDQQGTLQETARRLRPGGTCLIRVPTVSSYAWEHYGVSWYQIDAPRHFYLHSLESMRYLAAQAGMVLRSVVYDSTVDQFRTSEWHRRGGRSERDALFSRAQLRTWKRQAEQLNRKRRGDQAAFYLQIVPSSNSECCPHDPGLLAEKGPRERI